MAPFRSRGNFRGRGRGGRTSRSGRKDGFTSRTVEEARTEEQFNSNSPSPAIDDTSDISHESSSEEEEAAQPLARAYNVLLQAFRDRHEHEKPRVKRRKIEYVRNNQEIAHSPNEEEKEEREGVDAVDEEMEGIDEGDIEEDEDASDPFEVHFANSDEKTFSTKLKAASENQWDTTRTATKEGGSIVVQLPKGIQKPTTRRKIKTWKDLKLKKRLTEHADDILGEFSAIERQIIPALFDYQDILFGARTMENVASLRHLTCLHALNHIFKTRDRVIKNNAKLSTTQEVDTEYRDQGFTRPKVLMLLETRQSCVRAVEAMTRLCTFEQQENKKRFLDNFSAPEDKFSDDKPADFRELFEGQDDNEFRLGMKFTRKTVKFFSQFYNSDIILASALGLRRAIESGDPKKKDSDFLSSTEIVIMDQAEATWMQNWEHVTYIFQHLNLQPKDAHGCDFSRVRNFYLDGHAGHFRQTIVLSAYITPEIQSLFTTHMRNHAGRLRYMPFCPGTLSFPHAIRQTFIRYPSPSIPSDPDARFKTFTLSLLPPITKSPQSNSGTLIFIPSYLDFVRVRNYFAASTATENLSFSSISEYVDDKNIRRARSHFMTGKHSVLLYTGRAHHFRRYNIRGVKKVIMYALPDNPVFYEEIVGFLGASVSRGEVHARDVTVKVLFSKWDRLRLERVVGTERVEKMIKDAGDTFDFL